MATKRAVLPPSLYKPPAATVENIYNMTYTLLQTRMENLFYPAMKQQSMFHVGLLGKTKAQIFP